MKIFYLSTVCNNDSFEEIVLKSKKKPSASAQTFELSFFEGFKNQSNAELDINSFVPIAAYPGGCKLFWGRKKEKFSGKLETKWIPCFNVQIIKQFCLKHFSHLYLKKWLKQNSEQKDKCVVMYSLYPPVAESVIKLCKKFRCKCFVFIADLPELQFTTSKPTGIKKILAPFFRGNALTLQNEFDGYVFFTKQMSEVVGAGKPYTVIEGVCNPSAFNNFSDIKKSETPSIMYAGMLFRKYGIDFLVDSFKKLKGNYELWLFGDGDYVEEIKKASATDKRIKFFGRVSHEEVLKYEKQAHLLVNVRSDNEEYTKYSFPSKTMEYILSGTPILTSKLPGIPEEYYKHVFTIDDLNTSSLANKFEEIFSLSSEKRFAFGKDAQKWISENKNADIQVQKLMDFLNEVVIDESSSD